MLRITPIFLVYHNKKEIVNLWNVYYLDFVFIFFFVTSVYFTADINFSIRFTPDFTI